MKQMIRAGLIGLALLAGASAQASDVDVGVSVSIGQPGFYGRIDIGNVPQPRLVYSQPVIIERVQVRPAPIYLRVPPGHEKNWRKHCGRYGACGQQVYFVRDDWYRNTYVPYYREQHEHRGGRDDHRGDKHDKRDKHDDRGHPGKGHGKDKHGKGD